MNVGVNPDRMNVLKDGAIRKLIFMEENGSSVTAWLSPYMVDKLIEKLQATVEKP